MKYIFKDYFVTGNKVIFSVSVILTILIIIILLYIGIKVIRKK